MNNTLVKLCRNTNKLVTKTHTSPFFPPTFVALFSDSYPPFLFPPIFQPGTRPRRWVHLAVSGRSKIGLLAKLSSSSIQQTQRLAKKTCKIQHCKLRHQVFFNKQTGKTSHVLTSRQIARKEM